MNKSVFLLCLLGHSCAATQACDLEVALLPNSVVIETRTQQKYFDTLPCELIEKVLLNLNHQDALKVSLTSRGLSNLVRNDNFWRRVKAPLVIDYQNIKLSLDSLFISPYPISFFSEVVFKNFNNCPGIMISKLMAHIFAGYHSSDDVSLKIHYDHNNLGRKRLKSFMEGLKGVQEISLLSLKGNNLNERTLVPFLKFLAKKHIDRLDLSQNLIANFTGVNLTAALIDHPPMTISIAEQQRLIVVSPEKKQKRRVNENCVYFLDEQLSTLNEQGVEIVQ